MRSVFDFGFRHSLDDFPGGWQMAAVVTPGRGRRRMIITRTPLRIALGGGGTDLPSYYEDFGGLVISAAISKYIFISINRTFTTDYFLKYSALERVDRATRHRAPHRA